MKNGHSLLLVDEPAPRSFVRDGPANIDLDFDDLWTNEIIAITAHTTLGEVQRCTAPLGKGDRQKWRSRQSAKRSGKLQRNEIAITTGEPKKPIA
jgi:hypothetical protein